MFVVVDNHRIVAYLTWALVPVFLLSCLLRTVGLHSRLELNCESTLLNGGGREKKHLEKQKEVEDRGENECNFMGGTTAQCCFPTVFTL